LNLWKRLSSLVYLELPILSILIIRRYKSYEIKRTKEFLHSI
jgi:hypothetical protein